MIRVSYVSFFLEILTRNIRICFLLVTVRICFLIFRNCDGDQIGEKSSKEKRRYKNVGKERGFGWKVSNRVSVVHVNDIDHEWQKASISRISLYIYIYTLLEQRCNGWPYFPRDCPLDSLEFLFREITLLFRVHRWLKISPTVHELLRLNAYGPMDDRFQFLPTFSNQRYGKHGRAIFPRNFASKCPE